MTHCHTRTGYGPRLAALAIITVLASTALMYGDAAQACTCAPPPPSEEALAQSGAVFAGEVLDLTVVNGPDSAVVARMAVTDVWKGEVHEVVEVRTPADGARCGYTFEVGRADLVYSSLGDDGRFVASMCSRTAPVSDAQDDLVALDTSTAPLTGGPSGQPEATRSWTAMGVAAVALGLGGLLATITWVARRRA
ncbi:MAG: hypothetical protein WD250_12440 [Egibacteraceae bacterium]